MRFLRSSQRHNFYPRPPRGGRLLNGIKPCIIGRNFYPRPPRGGRPDAVSSGAGKALISIHALREEGDEAGEVPR